MSEDTSIQKTKGVLASKSALGTVPISAGGKATVFGIKGTHDILPGEVEKWQSLERLARETFEIYAYRELRAPVFEATELFEKSTGQASDIVTKEMYTFTDKGGRSLTLRPEYTPSVVRAIIEHRLDLQPHPLRFYYMGPMFRYDRPQKGRYRQFHQIDVEIFGEKDPACDSELIEMADRLLGKLGVTEKEILVNSVGCRACRPAYSRALREAAGKKTAVLCPDCQRKAETNPLRIFDCKVEACQAAARSFPEIQGYLCGECRDHFREVLSYLGLYGIPCRIEPRLVRGLDYYTKTTFEIVSPRLGAQNALLGGGRYDDMMKDFGGPDICGIGFAMGMERLLSVVAAPLPKRRLLYVAYIGGEAKRTAVELVRFFRAEGVECLIEFKDRGMKAHFSRANKLEASWVLVVGEDEIKKGRFGLKEMATGRQVEGARDEIMGILRG